MHASVHTTKSLLGSAILKIGAVVNKVFDFLKIYSHFWFHSDFFPFFYKKFEKCFKKLKTLLTTAPILRIVDPNKDFVVCTDACNYGLGGVLTQEGHIIAYESRKLKIHEKITLLMI